ncbi:MAG: strawberry notch C-terminal domain-containing protein [Bacteroidales bacterium]|nr:strawberry notch C-terminal domain-containing protein [Bacteroidales bacterium]
MKQIDIQFKTFRLKDDDRTLFCTRAKCDYNLNVLGVAYIPIMYNVLPQNWTDKDTWNYIPNSRLKDIIIPKDSATLSGAYTPAAELTKGKCLNVRTPDNMDESTANALHQLKKAVGNVAEFVAERLQYSLAELPDVLALEQIDAVALAIYNAESRNQGLIVGDQTGIGKGRVAAAFIRYGIIHGHKPIFFTEKPGLFSDIYRDLCDINCPYYKPLIINAQGGNIMDDDGNEVYKHEPEVIKAAIQRQTIPDEYDFVCCTYSQVSGGEKAKPKLDFLAAIATNNIIILDESHNAGGEVMLNADGEIVGGNTGFFFQTQILCRCKSVMYLSATYAKRPNNMPIYALNTCISDLTRGRITKEKILKMSDSNAVSNLADISLYFKSVPAQEIISSSMARFGQFIRRERETKGMTVKYYTLDSSEESQKEGFPDLKTEHWAIYKNITEIYARIRRFQEVYFQPYLKVIAENLARQGEKTQKPPTVASASLFSSLFHLTNNILLSIKAIPVAERAIRHIKEGKAVVIALADTNESVLKNRKTAGKDDTIEEDNEDFSIEVEEGMTINGDYCFTFDNIFKSLFYYNIKKGRKVLKKVKVDVDELGGDAVEEYHNILKLFSDTTSGLCFSPIDVIRERIEREGFSTAECTGRGLRLKFKDGDYIHSKIVAADKFSAQQGKHVSLCYKKFNNNEIDCLIINQSGSTGKSAHATNKNTNLKPEQVKQRVMLIAQAELDVNTEVQKRGRINRTGQFEHIPPMYEYIFSAIPCEKRFMMMLKAKLKSLDANTTSNQKQSNETVLKTDDFFNKYGDKIVEDVLDRNWDLNHILNDPLAQEKDPVNPKRKKQKPDEMARTVFGRMQVLDPERQEYYYNYVLAAYNAMVEKLIAEDKFDLEIKYADFQAKKISENILEQVENDGTHSELQGSSFLTKYSIRQQARFMSVKELNEVLNRNTQSGLADTDGILARLKKDYEYILDVTKEDHKDKVKEQITKQENKINELQLTINDYIEEGLKTDDLRERLKNENAKLKDLKKGKDEEFEEKLKSMKDKYDGLYKLIDKVRVGKFFEYESNIYCATQISVQANTSSIYSAPSNILISFSCTDPLNPKGINLNFAETGFNYMSDLVKKTSSQAEYDKFLKNDNRREEVSIITGNIVPYLKDGAVITRYTLDDGSMENGIVVKPELRNGVLEMPDYCKYANIPVNIKTKRPILASLSSGSRVDFVSVVGNGAYHIDGIRSGDNMKFHLVAAKGYKDFLFKPEVIKCFASDEVPFVSGEYSVYVENISKLLDFMAGNNFSARVAFSTLTQYEDALDFSKYKPKDWKPLEYDKKKIPSSKDYSPILIAEMELVLGESKAKANKKAKDTDEEMITELRIVDYSEKSWAVYGGSQKEWGKLKNAGAKYNSRLADGKGWILPKSKYTKSEILKLVA